MILVIINGIRYLGKTYAQNPDIEEESHEMEKTEVRTDLQHLDHDRFYMSIFVLFCFFFLFQLLDCLLHNSPFFRTVAFVQLGRDSPFYDKKSPTIYASWNLKGKVDFVNFIAYFPVHQCIQLFVYIYLIFHISEQHKALDIEIPKHVSDVVVVLFCRTTTRSNKYYNHFRIRQ